MWFDWETIKQGAAYGVGTKADRSVEGGHQHQRGGGSITLGGGSITLVDGASSATQPHPHPIVDINITISSCPGPSLDIEHPDGEFQHHVTYVAE